MPSAKAEITAVAMFRSRNGERSAIDIATEHKKAKTLFR